MLHISEMETNTYSDFSANINYWIIYFINILDQCPVKLLYLFAICFAIAIIHMKLFKLLKVNNVIACIEKT